MPVDSINDLKFNCVVITVMHDFFMKIYLTGIIAGSDGSFKVRAEAGTSENISYAFDVFMLQELPS
ncbi:MAG: hypothetical protein A3K77_00375 [Euryarchaeota archaeon RBG_13_31_8]|nr:MAG: hypothetical protein A3K77_00375 [Euryarchaeota archaeon RBG_13_31_8]